MTGRAALGALAAVVLLGLNLRTGVASLPPLLDDVRADLRLSGTAAGVLTALPVLAFGTFAPFVPRLVRRLAIERLLALCAAVTCAALALRGAGGTPALYAGTLLAGAGVAIAQGALPVYIRTGHAGSTGPLTGAFSMSLTLGAALAAALAVPLADGLGSWEASLAAWSLPAAGRGAGLERARAGHARVGTHSAAAAAPPAGLGRRALLRDPVDGLLHRAGLAAVVPRRRRRLLRARGRPAAGARRARPDPCRRSWSRCSRPGAAARGRCSPRS